MGKFDLPQYPHRYALSAYQIINHAPQMITWCLEQMGGADHSLLYDATLNKLVLTPTGNNNGWYPQGYSSIDFARASDLVLFKLTFGNG